MSCPPLVAASTDIKFGKWQSGGSVFDFLKGYGITDPAARVCPTAQQSGSQSSASTNRTSYKYNAILGGVRNPNGSTLNLSMIDGAYRAVPWRSDKVISPSSTVVFVDSSDVYDASWGPHQGRILFRTEYSGSRECFVDSSIIHSLIFTGGVFTHPWGTGRAVSGRGNTAHVDGSVRNYQIKIYRSPADKWENAHGDPTK